DGRVLLFRRLVARGRQRRRGGGEEQGNRQGFQQVGLHGGVLSQTETTRTRKGFSMSPWYLVSGLPDYGPGTTDQGLLRNRLTARGSVHFLTCLGLTLGMAAPAPVPGGPGFLYKASLVQAAPG